jgi:TatD DNase family protein
MYDLIDSHCHLDFDVFDSDRDAVIRRASSKGIKHIVIPGVRRENWARIREICNNNAHLHACYGLHPYLARDHADSDIPQLQHWLDNNDCVAIGECGLDYRKGQAEKDLQLKFFIAQLDIAQTSGKPVVIHSVRATADVINAIKNHPRVDGMIHSYSGSYEQAMQLIELGFFISLGGAITYENAKKIRATARKIPLASLLLETDAPDQPDVSHHNQRNEPAYLVNVLKCLSELRDESAEDIARETASNAKRLFNIQDISFKS